MTDQTPATRDYFLTLLMACLVHTLMDINLAIHHHLVLILLRGIPQHLVDILHKVATLLKVAALLKVVTLLKVDILLMVVAILLKDIHHRATLHKVTLLMVKGTHRLGILPRAILDHQLHLIMGGMGLTWERCWPVVQLPRLLLMGHTNCHMVLIMSAMEATMAMGLGTMASSSMRNSSMESMGCLDITASSRSGSNLLTADLFKVLLLY